MWKRVTWKLRSVVRSRENTHSAYLPPCVRRARLLLTLVDHHLERMWMLSVKPSSRDISRTPLPASIKDLFVYFTGMQRIWGSLGGCMAAQVKSLHSPRNWSAALGAAMDLRHIHCRHLQPPLEGALTASLIPAEGAERQLSGL